MDSPTPPATPYLRIGGEAGVRRLVDRFYDLMDSEPDVTGLRKMHPPQLHGSRDKLAWYLVGWMGGPPQYTDRFGHPRLRARHLPFAIGEAERDQWLRCMRQAMTELVDDVELRGFLDERLTALADHMRNQPG